MAEDQMHRKFVNTILFASLETNYIVVAIAIQSGANMDWRVPILQHGEKQSKKWQTYTPR